MSEPSRCVHSTHLGRGPTCADAVTDIDLPPSDHVFTAPLSLQRLSPEVARKRWKPLREATVLSGGSLFMAKSGWGGTTYFYHFMNEVCLCSLDPSIPCSHADSSWNQVFGGLLYLFRSPLSSTSSNPFPRRLIIMGDQWRGRDANLNERIMEWISGEMATWEGATWDGALRLSPSRPCQIQS